MTSFLEGDVAGAGRRVAVAVAEFNRDITDNLLQGCLSMLQQSGVADSDTTVARVPGAFELPALCQQLAATGNFDALVALGAVIRGDTPHFDFVAGECARGIMNVSLEHGVPVAFGVLTTDTLDQAQLRADLDALQTSADSSADRTEKQSGRSNKGAEAAEVALRMADLFERLS